MACKDCEEAQEVWTAYFYRWDNANVLLSACEKHTKEIFDALRSVQFPIEINQESP